MGEDHRPAMHRIFVECLNRRRNAVQQVKSCREAREKRMFLKLDDVLSFSKAFNIMPMACSRLEVERAFNGGMAQEDPYVDFISMCTRLANAGFGKSCNYFNRVFGTELECCEGLLELISKSSGWEIIQRRNPRAKIAAAQANSSTTVGDTHPLLHKLQDVTNSNCAEDTRHTAQMVEHKEAAAAQTELFPSRSQLLAEKEIASAKLASVACTNNMQDKLRKVFSDYCVETDMLGIEWMGNEGWSRFAVDAGLEDTVTKGGIGNLHSDKENTEDEAGSPKMTYTDFVCRLVNDVIEDDMDILSDNFFANHIDGLLCA